MAILFLIFILVFLAALLAPHEHKEKETKYYSNDINRNFRESRARTLGNNPRLTAVKQSKGRVMRGG